MQIWGGKSRGLRPADRDLQASGLAISLPRSAGLRPRDFPAPICRPPASRFPSPDLQASASRLPCPDLQASGLAISLPRSAGLRPRDFPAQICTPHAPDNPELPAWIQKNRRKNSPVAMSPPRTAGSLHTPEAPNEGDESSMAPGINLKKPAKRQPRLQANSKGLMTSWQQERTPKGGPDLGSISGTGTNGLDSACFDNDASKASIYCTHCARVPRNILGRVSRPIFGKEPLAQIFIRHDCRNFWLLDPAELLEQSGRQTLLLTQNTRALKGMAPLLQRHGFNDTCNNFRPHQNGKPPARCPRLFLSPSLLHKAFEPCKIACVAWLKRRRHSRWHIDQPQSQAMSKSE